MADYYTQFSVLFNPGEKNLEEALVLYHALRAQAEELDSYPDYSFSCEIENNKLWITDDESSDVEGAVLFVLACAKKFRLTGKWGMEWASTCSKARLDGFGGGAVVVNLERKTCQYLSTGSWMVKRLYPREKNFEEIKNA